MSSVPKQSECEEPRMYYKPENEFALEDAKERIEATLKEALENYIITKEEYTAMKPENKSAAWFYCSFKVHKPHENIPPERAIISGSRSITENISIFVDHHKR